MKYRLLIPLILVISSLNIGCNDSDAAKITSNPSGHAACQVAAVRDMLTWYKAHYETVSEIQLVKLAGEEAMPGIP